MAALILSAPHCISSHRDLECLWVSFRTHYTCKSGAVFCFCLSFFHLLTLSWERLARHTVSGDINKLSVQRSWGQTGGAANKSEISDRFNIHSVRGWEDGGMDGLSLIHKKASVGLHLPKTRHQVISHSQWPIRVTLCYSPAILHKAPYWAAALISS